MFRYALVAAGAWMLSLGAQAQVFSLEDALRLGEAQSPRRATSCARRRRRGSRCSVFAPTYGQLQLSGPLAHHEAANPGACVLQLAHGEIRKVDKDERSPAIAPRRRHVYITSDGGSQWRQIAKDGDLP